MRDTTIYEITITGFDTKYSRSKKNFKHTLIANNFCDTTLINMLPVSGRWLYLSLVLIASDGGKSTISMSRVRMKSILSTTQDSDKLLHQLQSLQLLTFKKTALSKEVKKERRKEGSEVIKSQPIIALNSEPTVSNVVPLGAEPSVQLNEINISSKDEINKKAHDVIASYCRAFKNKYSATPTLDPKDVGQLMRLCKVYGADKLSRLVQVYVQMEDPFFAKRKHDLGTFIHNLNKVGVAAQTGTDDDKKKTGFEFLDRGLEVVND